MLNLEGHCIRDVRELVDRWIDVEKSSSHHLSHSEIASDNPCSRQLSGRVRVSPTLGI